MAGIRIEVEFDARAATAEVQAFVKTLSAEMARVSRVAVPQQAAVVQQTATVSRQALNDAKLELIQARTTAAEKLVLLRSEALERGRAAAQAVAQRRQEAAEAKAAIQQETAERRRLASERMEASLRARRNIMEEKNAAIAAAREEAAARRQAGGPSGGGPPPADIWPPSGVWQPSSARELVEAYHTTNEAMGTNIDLLRTMYPELFRNMAATDSVTQAAMRLSPTLKATTKEWQEQLVHNSRVIEMQRLLHQGTEKQLTAWDKFRNKLHGLRSDIISFLVVVGAIYAAFRTLFNLMERGAQFEQTSQAFDKLITRTGAQTYLLAQLRTATHGTISDMQLMSGTLFLAASASGDLEREFVAITPQLVAIARAAHTLNPVMISTEEAYKRIAEAIKKLEPRWLDELGIKIRLDEVTKKYTDATGKAADALSAEEIQRAFTNEVLERGHVLIQQAGSDAEQATDKFDQMKTAWKNFLDALLNGRGIVGDVIEDLTHAMNAINAKREAEEALEEAWRQGIFTLTEYKIAHQQIVANIYDPAYLRDYYLWLIKLDNQRRIELHQTDYHARVALAAASATDEVSESTQQYADRLRLMTPEQLAVEVATNRVEQALQALNAGILDPTANIPVLVEALKKAEEELAKLGAAADTAKQQLGALNLLLQAGMGGDYKKAAEDYRDTIADLNEKLGPVNEKLARYEAINGKIVSGVGNTVNLQHELTDQTYKLDQAYGRLNKTQADILDIQKQLDEAISTGADPAWIAMLRGTLHELQADEASQIVSIDGIKVKLADLGIEYDKSLPHVANYRKAIEDAKKEQEGYEEKIRAATEALKGQIKQQTFNALQQALNLALQGQPIEKQIEGQRAMLAVAEELGLISADDLALMQGALTQAGLFAAGMADENALVKWAKDTSDALINQVVEAATGDKKSVKKSLEELREEHFAKFDETLDTTAMAIGKGETPSKETLSGTMAGFGEATDAVGKLLAEEAGEGGGLYAYRISMQGLISELANVRDLMKEIGAMTPFKGYNWNPVTLRWEAERGKAGGGDVVRNKPVVVGEEGPELFIPPQSGTIVPNNQLRGRRAGGGHTLNVVINDRFSGEQFINYLRRELV